MNVLHLISGNETGGGMVHVLSLLNILKEEINTTLGVFHDEEMAKRARNLGINVHVFKQKSRLDLSITKQIMIFIFFIRMEPELILLHNLSVKKYGVRG